VRDNLADCLSTLPALADRGASGPLHLYFALFEGMRRELFPRLAGTACAPDAVRATAHAGAEHWTRAGCRLLELIRAAPEGGAAQWALLTAERPALTL
jgi:hypothetical protein